MIYVKDLSKSFGDNQVISHIDAHIEPGEKVVIVGPSGSGKSTFLRCLNLLEQPDGGTITFDGEEITGPSVDINKVRRHMGMVFQHFNLFANLTVKKNIMLAPVQLKLMSKAEAEEEAMRLLRLVNLEDEANHKVRTFSGGMKRRLGIAQALLNDPRILILDEPMNSLDKQGVEEVRGILMGLRDEGKTIILASHNKEDIEILCDEVYEMDHGRLSRRDS